jgi:ribonuclease HI
MADPTAHVLVTDGACSGNGTDLARGGWAAILIAPDGEETVLTGGARATTNNRMELLAALEGLRAAPPGSAVELVTDSAYVAKALSEGWLNGWRSNGWRTSAKKPVANRDLWERMVEELARHRAVRPTLVKGHAGHAANERADRLAQEAATMEWAEGDAAGAPGDQLDLDVG